MLNAKALFDEIRQELQRVNKQLLRVRVSWPHEHE
jgi:hypothetical protein